MSRVSTTPSELGTVITRSTVTSFFYDFGIKTVAFKTLVSGDIYESAPITVPEPGNYTMYMYRATYGSAANANLSLKFISSAGALPTDISWGNYSFSTTSGVDTSILRFPSFSVTAPCIVKLKYATTTGGSIQSGDIILYKNS